MAFGVEGTVISLTVRAGVDTLIHGWKPFPNLRLRTRSVIMVNTQVRLTYEDYVELPDVFAQD